MRKYILIIICLVLCACSNKKVTVTCENTTNYGEGEVVKVFTKLVFDNKYFNTYSETITTESGFNTDEAYQNKKRLYEDLFADDTVKYYDFKTDDEHRIITIKSIDLNPIKEDKKEEYFAGYMIKKLEINHYKCEIEGATRKEIGLE